MKRFVPRKAASMYGKAMARFIQGDRPEADAELTMTGVTLSRRRRIQGEGVKVHRLVNRGGSAHPARTGTGGAFR